jgi:predicted DCC family thiol-disulfide oxidoreductase YuxK
MTKPILIFDGDCGFCTSCAEWARRHLKGTTDVVPGQNIDVAIYGLTLADVTAAAWWIDAEGHSHRGHRAVGKTLRACGGGWYLLSWFFFTPPFSWLASVAYRVVVRFRHRLPGATPACRIRPPDIR